MSGMISLLAGGEQTDRDLLRPGSPLGAAAAPDLARHHRRAHRLLGMPVRGLQPRAAKKREGRLPLPMEMVRESFVGRRVRAPSQRPVQPCFHLPASHRQARLADLAPAPAMAQGERSHRTHREGFYQVIPDHWNVADLDP